MNSPVWHSPPISSCMYQCVPTLYLCTLFFFFSQIPDYFPPSSFIPSLLVFFFFFLTENEPFRNEYRLVCIKTYQLLKKNLWLVHEAATKGPWRALASEGAPPKVRREGPKPSSLHISRDACVLLRCNPWAQRFVAETQTHSPFLWNDTFIGVSWGNRLMITEPEPGPTGSCI